MKIQFISDLHLEQYGNELQVIKDFIPNDGSDVLLLAGDIHVIRPGFYQKDIFDYLSENFKLTIYVPGNHEYYGGKELKIGHQKENLRDNVILMNNEYIDFEGVRFIGSTLWSKILPQYEPQVIWGMMDYSRIKIDHNRKLHTNFVNSTFRYSKDYIFSNISKELKNVVITHHLPSYSLISEQYKGNELNCAFASELYDEICDSSIDYWIYGHSHGEKEDVQIGKTWLSSNMVGYLREISPNFTRKNIIL